MRPPWTLSTRLVVAAAVGLASQAPAPERPGLAGVLLGLSRHLRAGCVHVVFDPQDRDHGHYHLARYALQTVAAQGIQTNTLSIPTFTKLSHRLRCSRNVALNVFVGGDITEINDVLLQVSKSIRMSDSHWLLYHPTVGHPEDLHEVFLDVDIPFDCQFVVACSRADGSVVLSEVYRVAPNLPLLWDHFGGWSPLEGFRGPPDHIYIRRPQLHGITLTAATAHEPPITILKKENGQPLRVEGSFGKLWTLLEKRMNFSTRFLLSEDKVWGGQQEDRSWDGMIGMLARGEAQAAVAEFTMDSLRMDVVDFTMPLINTKNCIFIKYEVSDSSELSWKAYVASFRSDIWAKIGGVILFLATAFFFAYKLTHKHVNSQYPPERSSFIDCLVLVFAAFCQQGLEVNTRTCSMLTLCLSTYLTSFIVHTHYSAQLISSLAVREYQLPFESFEGLLEARTYRLGVLASSGQLNNLKKATNLLMQQLYTTLVAPEEYDLPPTIEEGLRMVCEEDHYAFMTSYDVVLGNLQDIPCSVIAVPSTSYGESLAVALAKNSSYRKLINYNLLELRRTGVWHKLRMTEWPAKTPAAADSYESVSFPHVVPLATLLASSACLALLLLLCECRRRTPYTAAASEPPTPQRVSGGHDFTNMKLLRSFSSHRV